MLTHCFVAGCNSIWKPFSTIFFYRIPKQKKLRQKWLDVLGVSSVSDFDKVCSLHFKNEDFTENCSIMTLIHDAIPSINLPVQSIIQNKTKTLKPGHSKRMQAIKISLAAAKRSVAEAKKSVAEAKKSVAEANKNSKKTNSPFKTLEVCRICLATDLRLYSLEDEALKNYMRAVAGWKHTFRTADLPQFVCYECTAQLKKCHSLVERSKMAQTTLTNIFAQNKQITKSLIESHNRKLNPRPLGIHNQMPANVYHYQYDDETNSSKLVSTDFVGKKEEITEKKYLKMQINFGQYNLFSEDNIELKIEGDENINEVEESCDVDEHIENDSDNPLVIHEGLKNDDEAFVTVDGDEDNSPMKEEKCLATKKTPNKSKIIKPRYNTKVLKQPKIKVSTRSKITKVKSRNCPNELGPSDSRLKLHFKIVKLLTLQEQKDEWQTVVQTPGRRIEYFNYKCEMCSRPFAFLNTYQRHILSHDPSRGNFECPVCHLRFVNQRKAKSHHHRSHTTKYYCNTCPVVLANLSAAHAHHRIHAGHVHKCEYCPFTSNRANVLVTHARRQHAQATAWSCRYCGLAFSEKGLLRHVARIHKYEKAEDTNQEFRCEECNVNFVSKTANEAHLHNASQHNKIGVRSATSCSSSAPVGPSDTTCRVCGMQFKFLNQMYAHRRAMHSQNGPPAYCYPKKCEHCDTTVSSRREHWTHMRRAHRDELASYRASVTVLCDTCGKKFQNKALLRLHVLRHQSPTVRCTLCPKLFHDKYRLAHHMAMHKDTPPPHRCETCGRAFRAIGNLRRHYKVHSDVAPYECSLCHKAFKYGSSLKLHVRSVHQKIPPPPRRPRHRQTVALE